MNILLPVDFSENSRRAIDFAVTTLASSETYFYLLNVYSMPHGTTTTMFVSLKDEMKKDSEIDMTKELSYVKEKYPRVNISGMSVYGEFIEDTNRFIQRENISLVVMGTKGASGMKEVLIGSNASEAVQNLTAPVMTVPMQCEIKSPKKAVLAVDYLDLQKDTIHQLNGLLQQMGVHELFVMHVKDPDDETDLTKYDIESQLNATLKGVEFSFHTVENANVEDGIKQFREEVGGEMVIVINRIKGLWGKLFKTAHSKKLAMHTNISLLVLHEK